MQEKQLRDELRLASYAVEAEGLPYLERLADGTDRPPQLADYRFTWIAADGTVLFDTSAAADTMENHGDRAEVREAFAAGESGGVRYSSTLTEQTVYYARALAGGTVLRISISQATVFAPTRVKATDVEATVASRISRWGSIAILMSGIERACGPRLGGRAAPVFEPVMQAERAILPEFDQGRLQAEAGPVWRPRHLADHMPCRDLGHPLFERKTAFQRS